MNQVFLTTFLVLLINPCKQQDVITKSAECLEPFCVCINQNVLECSNFTRYDQLDFTRTRGRIFEKVELKPLTFQIDLNEKLNLNGLKLNGRLSFFNIRSINAFFNPFRSILNEKLDLAFYSSNFKFVSSNNSGLQDLILKDCDLRDGSQFLDFVFSNLKLNELILCDVYFEKTICPAFFRGSNIRNMIITNPLGAFGFSKLKQVPTDYDNIKFLNTFVNQIDFSFNTDQPQWLDAEYILNPDLFVYLDRININSAKRLAYIQEDTFKYLPSLKKLELNNVKLKELLTYNRRWLKNLNFRSNNFDLDTISLNSSMANNVFQLIIWANQEWDFNEERDICLFKTFPHNKLVFPFLLFTKTNLSCSCTVYWLYKYFSKYKEIYNLNQNIVPFHCFAQSNWDKCQFEGLFNRYCPNNVPELEESYTTLRPSVDFVTQTFIPSTFTTQSSTTKSTSQSLITTIYSTVTNGMIQTYQESCAYSQAAFYLAIALGVLAILIIIALAYLYYMTFKKNKSLNSSLESEHRNVADEYI